MSSRDPAEDKQFGEWMDGWTFFLLAMNVLSVWTNLSTSLDRKTVTGLECCHCNTVMSEL